MLVRCPCCLCPQPLIAGCLLSDLSQSCELQTLLSLEYCHLDSLFLHQGVLVSKPLSKVSPFLHVQPNILKLAVQLFSRLPALLKCQPSRQHHCLPCCHQTLCPVQKSLWRTAAASASMAPADRWRCRGELFQEEPAQPFFLVLV